MHHSKLKIVFVINPNAGFRRTQKLSELIYKNIDTNKADVSIVQENNLEATNAAIDKAINDKVDILAAVGGDGTVNHIGQKLIGTHTALAIIPRGSGNGLARHLNIPLNTAKAIRLLNNIKIESIDVGMLNQQPFFCAAGTGFDAEVIQHFHHQKVRGFLSYLKLSAIQYLRYKPLKHKVFIDGEELENKCFLISIANGSQLGNNAYIAPIADVQDGLLDVIILKAFPLYQAPSLFIKLFNKTLHHSKYVEHYQVKSLTIIREDELPIHYDGEPALMPQELVVSMLPKALKVAVERTI